MSSQPTPEHRPKKGDDHDDHDDDDDDDDDDGRPQRPRPGDEFIDQAPPDLRDEIRGLRKFEGKIMNAMKDPKMNDMFLRNPKAFFAALKIPLPPGLNRRLKNQAMQQGFLQSRAFRLPTGQTITPKLKVRFTGKVKPEDD
jgi:hypothetical protein